ncbi:MAG TPA: glycosyltransferase family 1 protein, partial [Paracoccaceae bacterium]|nr:glycosyltransferase family 1 protein [Paracoccaceae bacterium]
MRELIFDITELMASANGRLKYYGIARVVFEIGAELHKLDIGVRFAVYSASHKEFFEFTPNLDESSDYGVNFNIPNSLRQTRIRRMFYTRNKFRDLLAPLATRIIDRKNRRIWRESNAPSAPMDISNSIIVMAGRPKLMVDAIKTVKERGDDVLFVPLLHDVFSLHLSD